MEVVDHELLLDHPIAEVIGGGVNGGTITGATDDFGYRVVEKKYMIHDMHATMLHLMGIDHTKLTYRFSGRDMRLTDVHGQVIRDVVA